MGTQVTSHIQRIDIRDFYTYTDPLELLQSRYLMRSRIEKYWRKQGNPIPSCITELNNMAYRARHVATARREDFIYARTAGILGLTPGWSEFVQDKYVQMSRPKTSLLRMALSANESISIADPKSWEGRTLSEITTKAGTNLVDFHHRLWNQIPGTKVRIDCSDWVQSFGNAEDYYFPELSLYVAHGVLFNDFHPASNPLSSNGSAWFTEKIVEPAFEKVKEVFGVSPIIFPFSYQPGFEIYPQISYSSRKAQKNGR